MFESEKGRRHLLSRRAFIKTALFGASAGWTGWAIYLYDPPNSKLRDDYNQAWERWNKSADQLVETNGVWEKAGFLHGPKLDPNNPFTSDYYAAQTDVKSLGEKIKSDEFPIVQAQMYGESFGPLVTLLAGAVLLIPQNGRPIDNDETETEIQQSTDSYPQIF
jgi:hypothetical protein